MIDVSAQSCNVTPLNPSTLTAIGGAIVNGTMNVRIQCNCTESGGRAVNIVRWYDPDGTRLVSTRNIENFNPNVPHFTRVTIHSDRDVILVIPTFNDSYDGRYTCGRNADDRSALTPPTADVTLTIISELMINKISCLLHICSSVVALINCYLYSEMVKFIVKARYEQMKYDMINDNNLNRMVRQNSN